MSLLVSLLAFCGAPEEGGFAAAAKVLSNHCVRCHNADKTRGGLDLSTQATALSGGATRDAIVPGDPEKSLLVERARDHSMPPPKDAGPLTAREVEFLARWIAGGAIWPDQTVLTAPDQSRPRPQISSPPIAPASSSHQRRRWFWRSRQR